MRCGGWRGWLLHSGIPSQLPHQPVQLHHRFLRLSIFSAKEVLVDSLGLQLSNFFWSFARSCFLLETRRSLVSTSIITGDWVAIVVVVVVLVVLVVLVGCCCWCLVALSCQQKV